MTDIVSELKFLVSLNDEVNGGPYMGHAAQRCMIAMNQAISEIIRLLSALSEAEKERDEARVWHSKAKVFLEELGDTRIRAEKAEAELAQARKALETAYQCAGCGCITHDPKGQIELYRLAGKISCCPERKMVPLARALLTDTGRTEGE